MTPQKQRFSHRPEQGEYGDCYRTALACLLDVDRDSVPNFGEHYDDIRAFYAAADAWLRERGLRRVEVAFQGDLATVFASQAAMNPGVYYLLGGQSDRGWNHSVVGCGGEIVCDPHPSDTGLVGPCDDGYWWVTYLVRLEFVRIPVDVDEPAEAPTC